MYFRFRKRKLNIKVDKILGVSVMIFLLFYVSHPGDYLLTTSHVSSGAYICIALEFVYKIIFFSGSYKSCACYYVHLKAAQLA